MGRYTGPSCRLCRREGVKLYIKGERCLSPKCAIERRKASPAPGMHGKDRKKPTEYGVQLREKQKVKRYYGVYERQFKKYFEMATHHKGVTGEMLLQYLERRLDNVVYVSGFALSHKAARQLVRHGHVLVNGEKVDIPSVIVKVGDVVSLAPGSEKIDMVVRALETASSKTLPTWLEIDLSKVKATVKSLPTRAEMCQGILVNEQAIVELYSK
ncbi:30S ribosomal protein S4 [Thermospira aquatica]|uniref:Small ribosomal subunit protein uS4 n=1 Tax=Thermospira aquatica TaxID=2828656 RepID=A0AAX3B9W4_9SPIR|nr:30S ribosomal protein S4 [Thermospira aquatica]URA09062.1 30S ribosomal protein S4 [Thermospira aquatica]